MPADLEALRAFVAIAEHGSLSAAARARGLAKATLSRQLGELERDLGTALVRRTTRAQSLTAAGRALFDRVAPLVVEADAAVHDIAAAAAEPTGTIRIAAALGFGQTVLVPLVARFLAKHPKLRCELVLSDERVRVVDAGFDLAIRMGTVDDSELPARRLARIACSIVASPRYLKEHGTPRTAADLRKHAALVVEPKRATWSLEREDVRVAWRVATGSMPALVEAARQGLGIALAPDYMVAALIAAGELVRLDFQPTSTHATALLPNARMAPAAVRRFLDFVVAEIAKDPAF